MGSMACLSSKDDTSSLADEQDIADFFNNDSLPERDLLVEDSELDSESTTDHRSKPAVRFLQDFCHGTAKINLSRTSTGFSSTSQSSEFSKKMIRLAALCRVGMQEECLT